MRRRSEEERNWLAASRHVQVIRSSISLMNRAKRCIPQISDSELYSIEYMREVAIHRSFCDIAHRPRHPVGDV